jgi:DNA-binding winged helix-turn-helix (wHTH) protein/Tol biopolymer transport system component
MKELKAAPAVRAAGGAPGSSYQFGPFLLDVRRGRLWRGGEPVALTRKAIDTLTALVVRAGDIVEKEDLMAQVWPDTVVTEDTLTQNISTLRKALGDTAEVPEYIATVPRRGYRFVATITPADRQPQPAMVEPAGVAPGPQIGTSRWRERLLIALAALSTASALVLGGLLLSQRGRATPLHPFRFAVLPPQGTTLASAGIVSPDGHIVAFVVRNRAGRRQLMVRSADALDPVLIAGTAGASQPFWSPDSRAIGFFTDGRLKRVSISGGPPITLAETSRSPQGGSWSATNIIIYAPGRSSPLRRIPASGGPSSGLTALRDGSRESGHWWPQFLPGGTHFLYSVASADPSRAGLYVGSLDQEPPTRLLDGASLGGIFASPGHLLFQRERALMAQPFDLKALRLTGTASPVASGVAPPDVVTGLSVSASNDGLLSYVRGTVASRLTWFDRSGRVLQEIDAASGLRSPALSPDGRFVAAHRVDMARNHLCLLELDRGVVSRFAADGSTGQLAVWSPDGRSIAFSSDRQGSLDLYVASTLTASSDRLLVSSPSPKRAYDWSPDGQLLLYGAPDGEKIDLWLARTTGDPAPVRYLRTPFNENQAQISPNGRWLAYASDESGAWEVYLQSFPKPGQKRRVSAQGGGQPKWRRDGQELFYLGPDGRLMAAAIREEGGLDVDEPRVLFEALVPGSLDAYRNYYVASPDGQRFLVDAVTEGSSAIVLLQDWISPHRSAGPAGP